VDESMLTGESAPVNKTRGAVVYGGTANLHRWLLARVNATGDATALAQIISAVQRAQTSRATIQRLGDRVSSVFVPVVILVALAAGALGGVARVSARGGALVGVGARFCPRGPCLARTVSMADPTRDGGHGGRIYHCSGGVDCCV